MKRILTIIYNLILAITIPFWILPAFGIVTVIDLIKGEEGARDWVSGKRRLI